MFRGITIFKSVAEVLIVLAALGVSAVPAIAAEDSTETALSLKGALVMGIEQNLDLLVEELNVPIRRQEVTASDAVFDPALEAAVFSGEQRLLTGSVFFEDEFQQTVETGGSVGLRKKYDFGLQTRLALESLWSENNSLADALDPQYRNFLVLNLTQPLLKDFGPAVNTTDLRISQNRVQQAALGFLNRAQQVGEAVELAYYDLARTREVLDQRIASRELARDLVRGNQEKFEGGMIAVTEVDEARSALAAREEAVILARQQMDTAANQLKDLLEIRADHPLFDATIATEPIPAVDSTFPEREAAMQSAFNRRPDLKQLKLNLVAQDIRLAFYRNQKLPRIDLGATLGLNGLAGGDRPVSLTGIRQSSPLVGAYQDSIDRLIDGDGYQWSVDLRFSYPLGNRSAEALYARSKIEKRQLLYRVKRLEGAIETEVKNALVAVQRSRDRARVAVEFEELAKSTLSQETERLRQGLSDTFRIIRFQDDLIAARIRRVTAEVDFHRGLARLFRSMGENLARYHIVAEIDRETFSGLPPIP